MVSYANRIEVEKEYLKLDVANLFFSIENFSNFRDAFYDGWNEAFRKKCHNTEMELKLRLNCAIVGYIKYCEGA